MFQGIKDWLFKEEEEPVENVPVENEVEEPVEEEKEEIIVQPVVQEVVEEKPVVKEEPKINKITIESNPGPMTTRKPKEVRPIRTTLKKEEYEIPQIISPYYGAKEEKKVETKKVVSTPKKVVQPKEKEVFNAVISPFYGKKERKPIIQPKEEVKEVKVEKVKEQPILVETKEIEGVNLSLDEIVSTKNENDDDLIQFSLFGGEKRIKEEDFKNENIASDDDLPF